MLKGNPNDFEGCSKGILLTLKAFQSEYYWSWRVLKGNLIDFEGILKESYWFRRRYKGNGACIRRLGQGQKPRGYETTITSTKTFQNHEANFKNAFNINNVLDPLYRQSLKSIGFLFKKLSKSIGCSLRILEIKRNTFKQPAKSMGIPLKCLQNWSGSL